jgi:hypothetical protein
MNDILIRVVKREPFEFLGDYYFPCIPQANDHLIVGNRSFRVVRHFYHVDQAEEVSENDLVTVNLVVDDPDHDAEIHGAEMGRLVKFLSRLSLR